MANQVTSRLTRTTSDSKFGYEILLNGTGYKVVAGITGVLTAYDAMVVDVKAVVATLSPEVVDRITTIINTV